MEPL
ncbi:unnamed protein product, partial [Adineta ricciae]|jgi:hypothetical protein